MYIIICSEEHNNMREWLSGGAPPCQGGGRGFDPRLALFLFDAETFIFKGFRCFYVFGKNIPQKAMYKPLFFVGILI